MPANLTPQYHEAERKFKEAKNPEEKLRLLREMFSVIPKHKGTEKLQADLKRRISKLQDESQKSHKSGRRPYAFAVEREGASQMALVGPPNSGKSSMLRALTRAEPEVAPYPFTTRMPLPGMMHYEDIQIQLVDLPAISDAGTEHWVPQIIRGADAVLVVLDLSEARVLEDMEMLEAQLAESATYLAGAGPAPVVPPNSMLKKSLVVGNKSDLCPDNLAAELLEAALSERPNGLGRLRLVQFSSSASDNAALKQAIFDLAGIIRVYTKVPGHKPDMDRPFVLPAGSTLIEVAALVHKDFVASLKFARIWGSGAFEGQCIQRDHVMRDKDVVELHI